MLKKATVWLKNRPVMALNFIESQKFFHVSIHVIFVTVSASCDHVMSSSLKDWAVA